jgi:hypothetical protein
MLKSNVILLTFRGQRPPGHQALHWDDDPQNDELSNLRWGTREDNIADMRRNQNLPQRENISMRSAHFRRAIFNCVLSFGS